MSMELPSRQPGDQLLPDGECLDIRRRLRSVAKRHDLATVIVNAFDRRTRMLPFFYSSTRMAPAGVRAIGSALADSGFVRTRIVLQQWNPNFSPSRMTLDGRMPDLLLISSMQIHAAACNALLRDACRIDPALRPLIIVGGPRAIYEPWTLLENSLGETSSADIAVRGEEYVLLNLLEVLLSERSGGESLRSAFLRARSAGLLDRVPGLVYAHTSANGVVDSLVETGVQRLLRDLDELPHPSIGYSLLEPPSRQPSLAGTALDAASVHKHSVIGSLVLTAGCKFSCPYCPIPAFNQRQLRFKSPQRIVEEMTQLHGRYGMKYFFGTDDNFFNSRQRALEIVEGLAEAQIAGKPLHRSIYWATEATIHDTLQMRQHLPTVRKAGVMALWLGVEDMTATFVKKGQSIDRTAEAFALLRQQGIMPVPMLMQHDGQPLYSRKGHYGLLNQVNLLRRNGAIDIQVLTMTPAVGSRIYEQAFTSGQVIGRAGGKSVEPYMFDGNYVLATSEKNPALMQLRLAAVLIFFYNPLRLIWAMIRPKCSRYLVDPAVQAGGMLALLSTLPRMLAWATRLALGKIARQMAPSGPKAPMRAVRQAAPNDAEPST